MRNFLNKKKKLFDGDQDQFVQGMWSIGCCSCEEKINFGVSDCQSFLQLNKDLQKMVIAGIKNIESKSLGDTTFYKVEGLPLHFFKLICPSCEVTNLGILGLGEYQPARYMVQMVGLMTL